LLRSLRRTEQPTSQALEGYLSKARAARNWQNLLRVGSGILLIFSGPYYTAAGTAEIYGLFTSPEGPTKAVVQHP